MRLPVGTQEVSECRSALPPRHQQQPIAAFSVRPQDFAADESLGVRHTGPDLSLDVLDQGVDLTCLDRGLPHTNDHANIIPDHSRSRNGGAITMSHGGGDVVLGSSDGDGSPDVNESDGDGSPDVDESEGEGVVSGTAQRWSGTVAVGMVRSSHSGFE